MRSVVFNVVLFTAIFFSPLTHAQENAHIILSPYDVETWRVDFQPSKPAKQLLLTRPSDGARAARWHLLDEKLEFAMSGDKEIIRRIIRQHIAQIRYCYEKELTRSPGLFGKVRVEFVISAKGGVQSTKVIQTTLKNSEVERCIQSKIRTWKFPEPKGGGIVIVKYPFIFKTSG